MIDYALGIDLGTTYVAAAIARGSTAEIVHLGNRAAVIPSLVWVGDDGVMTGEAAARRAGAEPQLVAREFKRRIGDSAPILLGGIPMSPQLLMSRLLEDVLGQVRERMGGPSSTIALTYPASWSPFKIDALTQAARGAGVSDAMFLTEPEAAARYHASIGRLRPGDLVAIYDLGGGTFDCTVGQITDQGFDVLGTPEGVEHLGGIDMDEAVFDHVLRSAEGALDGIDVGDVSVTAALSRLRRDCVEAKEALSIDDSTIVTVTLGSSARNIVVERADIERAIRPLIDETVRTVARTLSTAGVDPAQLAAILLVGGASRMPIVAAAMSEAFGRPISVENHPKHAIALGAALAAGGSTSEPAGEPTVSNETFIVPTQSTPDEPSMPTTVVPVAPAGQPMAAPIDPAHSVRADVAAPVLTGSVDDGGSGRRRRAVIGAAAVGGVAVAAAASFVVFGGGGDEPETSNGESAGGGIEGAAEPPGSDASETAPTEIAEPGSTVLAATDTETAQASTCGPPPGSLLFQSNRNGLSDVYSMLPDGSAPVNLTNSADWNDLRPAASPDGTRFAFISTGDGDFEITVADIDGTNEVRLTDNDVIDANPTWSPDGTRIAFDSARSGDRELWVMNADGSDPQQLTDSPGMDSDPSWSPVDDRLVFNTDRFGSADIAILDMISGEITAVTNTPSTDDFHPAWSPDGRTVSFGPDNTRIALYDTLDGTVTEFPTPGATKGASWSHDGCWLSFTSSASADDVDGEEIWIAPLDGTSSPVQLTNNDSRDDGSVWVAPVEG